MYTSFFGLTENPFTLTPDPRYLYLSPHHREALDYLLYGINERKGFIVITGGIGTGKTTLCRSLLTHLTPETKTALIFNAFISDVELLETVNQEFGISQGPKGNSRKEYIDQLNRFLLNNFSEGGNAVLLIDEAQNLSHQVLEQIRMLSNLETEKEKLIQIILVGQPELRELLASPSLRQLDERITVRYNLRPLNRKDLQEYIEHRLVVAGSHGNVKFRKAAVNQIFSRTQGNPRRVNAVCDRALLIAYAKETHTISKNIVRKAGRDLYGDMKKTDEYNTRILSRKSAFVFLILLLLALAGLSGWTYRSHLVKWLSQGDAPIPQPRKYVAPVPPKPKGKEKASLFLDESESMARLFDLFSTDRNEESLDWEEGHLALVSFRMKPEYYVLLKKPFRVHLGNPPFHEDRYLLIREVASDGALAIDASGKPQRVSREFIMENWGRRVSWLYPYPEDTVQLMKGMEHPDVTAVQEALNQVGYLVGTTGTYGDQTAAAVKQLQEDFKLEPDGIFGPRTRALLYQMVNHRELHS